MNRYLLIGAVALHAALAVDWAPVDPAQLSLKEPAIDKNADAEVLYWEVRISDKVQAPDIWTTWRHYLRIKVFTERGAKDQATLELGFRRRTVVTDLAGRTIQPDGSIAEVAKDAIKETDVLKGKKVRGFKVRTMAFPAVKPGSIVEYQYTETTTGIVSNYSHLHFSRDLPVHHVKYLIKPLSVPWLPFQMRIMNFGAQVSRFQPQRIGTDDFHFTESRNIPAFKEEPNMPPDEDVRPWLLIYYEEDKKLTPEKYWKEVGRDDHKLFMQKAKSDGDVKRLGAELGSKGTTPEEKANAILEYCRVNIKNVNSSASGLTTKQLESFKENRHAGDTLKQKMGTGNDINMLFAALANAAGLDARLARVAQRTTKSFGPQIMTPHFLDAQSIAIKAESGWKFYDAAATRIPSGMLRWQEEGTAALITDSKEPTFVNTPMTPAEKNKVSRFADLTLDVQGALEGSFRLAYNGHHATEKRFEFDQDTDAEKTEKIIDLMKSQFPGAEVTAAKIENLEDLSKPVVISGQIKLQAYGQRTGKRLFFQPAFFQFGDKGMFPESTRRYPVQFQHGWTEADRVTITLPEEFELDQPSAPGDIQLAKVGYYKGELSRTNDGRKLVLVREFAFGLNDAIYYPVDAYPHLKKAFDTIHELDTHTISLKAVN